MIDASATTQTEPDPAPCSDASDWQSWFDTNAPALVLFARQWTGSFADAEDVVQESFVRFWNTGRHRADDPKAYLFAAVKHAALDQRRGQRRRERRELRKGVEPRDSPLFATNLEAQEWSATVETALARLPEPQREVLVLKIWGDLTFSQISAVLKAAPNTVASRYRYALEALRRLLAEEDRP